VRRITIAVSLLIFVGLLMAVVMTVHPFGYPPSQMDDYIIENAQTETGANNVVSAVVFDYRGFDTLGEATILFTAVTGVVTMFRRKKEEAKSDV